MKTKHIESRIVPSHHLSSSTDHLHLDASVTKDGREYTLLENAENSAIFHLPVTFPFPDSPIDIQQHIYSWLSWKELTRLRAIDKKSRQNIDDYLKQLDVQLKWLGDLEKAYAINKSAKIGVKLESILDAILNCDRLNDFLSTHLIHRINILTYLHFEGRIPIDWEKKDPGVQQAVLNLFLEWAPDEDLAKFVAHKVCPTHSEVDKDRQLLYPSFSKLFFKELTDQQIGRLAVLPIADALLIAMGCSEIHFPLFARLYEQQPDHKFWDLIRLVDYRQDGLPCPSYFSAFIHLRPGIWLADTINLLKNSTSENSLSLVGDQISFDTLGLRQSSRGWTIASGSINTDPLAIVQPRSFDAVPGYQNLFGHLLDLSALFNSFIMPTSTIKMPLQDYKSLEEFAWIFLLSAQSLDTRQMQAVAYALTHASLFINYSAHFMQVMFAFPLATLEAQGLLNPDSVIVSLLKPFISLKAAARDVSDIKYLVEDMTRPAHLKAFIDAVKDGPEPWRTLYLSVLIRNEEDEVTAHSTSTEERREAFWSCGLNYDDYPYLSNSDCHYMGFAFTRDYLQELHNLDDEDKLAAFLERYAPKTDMFRTSDAILRPLVSGLVLSKKLTLKPHLDSELIKQHLANRGLLFNSEDQPIPIDQPISIEDFLCDY